MSLTTNLVSHIATNSSLVIDTDLFVAQAPFDNPNSCVWVQEVAGSTKNESELQQRIIAVYTQDITYLLAETLANVVFDILEHKPGFSGDDLSSENILYCEPVGMPGILHQDSKGRYVFLSTFMVRKR